MKLRNYIVMLLLASTICRIIQFNIVKAFACFGVAHLHEHLEIEDIAF